MRERISYKGMVSCKEEVLCGEKLSSFSTDSKLQSCKCCSCFFSHTRARVRGAKKISLFRPLSLFPSYEWLLL